MSQYLPQLCSCVLSSGLDLSLLYAMLREKVRLSSGTFGVRSVLCSYLSWKWSGPGGSVKNQILLVLLSSPSSSTPPPPFSFHVHITVSLSYGSLSLCRYTHATCFQNGYPRRSRGGGGGPDCVCVPLPLLRLPGITRVPRSPPDDAATSSSTSMRIWQSGGGRARVRAAAEQPTPLCFYVLSKAERTSERRRRGAAWQAGPAAAVRRALARLNFVA